MPKISEFMIALVFIGFIMTTFGYCMASLHSRYGPADYDNDTLSVYDQLNDMSSLAEDLKEGSNIQEKTGALDIIGNYFTGAYNVLKLTTKSYNTFDEMTNAAIDHANMGQAGENLRIAICTAVLIIIIVAVLISAILKWWV